MTNRAFSNRVFSILIIPSILPFFSLIGVYIVDKVNEQECYKNVLRSSLSPRSEKTLNRATYMCKGATSSAHAECYENILHSFPSLPSEETLDRVANLCAARNLINATYLPLKKI